jgi:predicted ATPase
VVKTGHPHSRGTGGSALVTQIAGKTLPDEVIAQIVERTDGAPLFVEELTKRVLESELLREEALSAVSEGERAGLVVSRPHRR